MPHPTRASCLLFIRLLFGTLALQAVLALPGAAHEISYGTDYTVAPTPPALVKDEATTFLVDFATPKDHADFCAATTPVALDAKAFDVDGGYSGAVTIPTAGVLDGPAWTIEMILRLPAATAASGKEVALGGWKNAAGDQLRLSIHPSSGPGWTLQAPARPGTRLFPFRFGATGGGGGATLAQAAADRWVAVTMGLDLAGRRGAAIVRDLDGHVLRKDMRFFQPASLGDEFVRALPEAERLAAIDRCWKDMLAASAGMPPATFTLGSDAVELRALRISNRFRPEIAYPQAVFERAEGRPHTAAEVDPARAVATTPLRRVGYGKRNAQDVPVAETAITLAPGDRVTMKLPSLPVGLYSCWLYGSVDPKGRTELDRVWRPAPMEFEVTNARKEQVGRGRLLLKQSLRPRFMQAFSFHVDEPGDFTATFTLLPRSRETVRLQQIDLVDCLAGLPDEAVKTEQRLGAGKPAQLAEIGAERRARDDLIWNAMPPLNVHTIHQPPPAWRTLPASVQLPAWDWAASLGRPRPSVETTIAPLTVIDPATQATLPPEQFVAGAPLPAPATLPAEWNDDGTGIFLAAADHSRLAGDMYATPRARLNLQRLAAFAGLVYSSAGGGTFGLPQKYLETGDPEVGHDAAMALVRLAYDWPALEYGVQDIRLCTHDPDLEFNQHWSYGRGGKLINWSWSADDTRELIESYDKIFPYIHGNRAFAAEVHRFIPWIKTPEDVIRLIDRQLVFASVRDVRRGFLAVNRDIEDMAGRVLGPKPATADLFDLTRQNADFFPFTGTYQEGYATGLSRSGCYYAPSFLCYALGSAKNAVAKSYSMLLLRKAGVTPVMDISDVDRYPKIRAAADFLVDMWVAGGFPFMVGDASGGPHTGRVAYRTLDRSSLEAAFAVTGDPRIAWILAHKHGVTDAEVLRAAAGRRDPILHNESRVVPDFGVLLEMNPDETDPTRKTGATFRLGIGRAHAHADYLDVNFFAMGLPVAVDLACRNEGKVTWSRPPAPWAFVHNHAIAHDTDNPKEAGGQDGEPWLRAFAPPLVRGSYTNSKGTQRLDRDLVLMEVGTSGTFYAFDVQRLAGGTTHTWCFHGCESDGLDLNVPMQDGSVRWTDRTLENTRKTGTATDVLQAVWTMTREPKDHPHTFQDGGVVEAVACEPTVLGDRYDAALPPVHVRATLLGQAGQRVLQGSPYSQQYQYCFPFLWVQGPAREPSVYPAVYEWYRGAEPVVAKAEVVGRDPLRVRVTTTSGQIDDYTSTPDGLAAVSRDAEGLRWAQVNGLAEFAAEGLSIKAATDTVRTTITDIDYRRRALTTKDPLPENPGIVVGSPDRWCWLQLQGRGTSFTWRDELLFHEGLLTGCTVTGSDAAVITTNQKVPFVNAGNRKAGAFTTTTEDGGWHFRSGRVVRRPAGATLSESAFTDANGDGLVNAKTWEIGLNDEVLVPADLTIRRTDRGYEVRTNVRVTGRVGDTAFTLEASPEWQQ
jgi:hypothetical protein